MIIQIQSKTESLVDPKNWMIWAEEAIGRDLVTYHEYISYSMETKSIWWRVTWKEYPR